MTADVVNPLPKGRRAASEIGACRVHRIDPTAIDSIRLDAVGILLRLDA